MLRAVLSLVIAGALFVPAAAAQQNRPSPVALRVKLKSAASSSAKQMTSLATWCDKNGFPAEAAEWRLRAVALTPDDAKLRKKTGFVKDDDSWRWDETARARALETLTAPGDGEVLVYEKRVRSLRKRIGTRYAAIAAEAKQLAKTAPDDDERLAWEQSRASVWETLLAFDRSHQQALKELGHPELAGKYVHRDGADFVRKRLERHRRAQETWASAVSVERVTDDPERTWQRAKCGDVTIDSTWGLAESSDLAKAAARATREAHRTLGLTGARAVLPNLRTFGVARTRDEQEVGVKHYFEWTDAKVAAECKRWRAVLSGRTAVIRDRRIERAADTVMAYRARGVVWALHRSMKEHTKLPKQDLESWILEALTADILIRLTGSYFTNFVTDGRYADEKRDFEGSGWLGRVWRFHDLGVLPPLRQVVQRELNQLDTLHATAGYGFLLFLFEQDPEDAATFLQLASHAGSEAAARVTFEKSLEDLDAEYRRWLDVARYDG